MSNTKKEKENSKKTAPQFHKLMEMPVNARLVLGECRLDIEEILKLGQGSMPVSYTHLTLPTKRIV